MAESQIDVVGLMKERLPSYAVNCLLVAQTLIKQQFRDIAIGGLHPTILQAHRWESLDNYIYVQ